MTTEVARVLARAFVTNPINAAALGADQLARNEAFFRGGLGLMKGTKLVAVEGSRIVGLIHWVQSPGCQMAGVEKLKTIPAMVCAVGLRSALRIGNWLSAWEKHDLKLPHLHLGPIGVDPAMQGKQVGRKLMEQYCEALDRTGIAGYLETDRPENVAFYRRFGFETIEELPVLAVRNFLMQRPSRP